MPDDPEGVIPPRKRPRYVGARGSIRATAREQAEAEREGRETEFEPEQHGANPWTDYEFPEPKAPEPERPETPKKRPRTPE